MIYYLALVWNEFDPVKCHASQVLLRRIQQAEPEWQIAVNQEGLIVCHAPPSGPNIDRPYLLHNRTGVVIGKLFDANYVRRSDTHEVAPSEIVLDERRTAAILSSAGRDLIDNYWGQYVAFLRDARTTRNWVLRDPAGGMPCRRTQILGIDVYFVRLDDCETLHKQEFSINTRYLLGYLLLDSTCVKDTGFNEVINVLPGECITYHKGHIDSTFYWNPLQIANANIVEDPGEASALLHRTVRACVHAWASCFDGIFLQLSGGLDSSIVASCLADAPTRPRVLCSNYYGTHPGTDERFYARLVATRFGFDLHEEASNTTHSFDLLDRMPKTPCPFPWWSVNIESSRKHLDLLRSRGMETRFAGHGGDEIFYTGGTLPTAVDYAWRHGISRKLLSVALDDALALECSLWKILRLAGKFGISKRPWAVWNAVRSHKRALMRPEAIAQVIGDPQFWHPLYRTIARMAPGKFQQAYMFTYGTATGYVGSALGGELVGLSPLLSQPLLELSLRIPLHVLRAGGRNRALARRTFSQDLPQEIIERKTKAFSDAQIQTVVDHNIPLVRELLLDGLLVREGLLDRTKIEKVLSGELTQIKSGIAELCAYLNVEGWARSWNILRRQAAA